MDELTIIAKWLYATLHGDTVLHAAATGGFYDGQPADAVPPYVLWEVQGTSDVLGVGAVRLMTTSDYLVRFVAQTKSYNDLTTAADRIEALLDRVTNADVSSGGVVVGHISCYRTQPWRDAYKDESTGLQYRELGGIYQIAVQRE